MSTSEHFNCHYCKDSLLGKKYIMKEDTQYCTKCYENLFANCCEGCSLPIGCNSKVGKRQFYPESDVFDVRNVENKNVCYIYLYYGLKVRFDVF